MLQPIVLNKIRYREFTYNVDNNILEFYIDDIDYNKNNELRQILDDIMLQRQFIINDEYFKKEFIYLYSEQLFNKFINNKIKAVSVKIDYKCYQIIGADSPSCIILGYYITIEFD